MALTPRNISIVSLAALAPVAAYALGDAVVALSLVCVLVIVGSLYTMFGPAEGTSHDAEHQTTR